MRPFPFLGPTVPFYSRHAPLLHLLALLSGTWLAYTPGLSGGFLFDDFVNLDALGAAGPIHNAAAFWRYVTSGSADPIGRPLSLLTFLLDARDWPADPAPFLRTNVLLHLANGALLFALLRMLGRRMAVPGQRADATALLAAGLWLLHPLFVSTTLYVVQREAMLPATFILLGLLAYVHGRTRLDAGQRRAGLVWMLGGLVLGTALATLSKANGVLLPLLAWVLEATVLRASARHTLPRWFHAVALLMPSAVVFAYLARQLGHLDTIVAGRTWSIAQRLLTEPRVLVDYLQLLLVPRVLSTGLYNDDYVASQGLLSPATTLPALILVAALVVAALGIRRRAPVLSAALLFFLAGHVLESTSVPLELYFEHRNYLPAMLLGWPLALSLGRWNMPRTVRIAVGVALLGLLGVTTWQRATVWGHPDRMALLWAAQNPHSARAQAAAAEVEAGAGHAQAALRRLAPWWARDPYNLQLALNYANAACVSGGLAARDRDRDRIGEAFAHAREGHALAYNWLGRAIDIAQTRQCPGIDLATVQRWLAAAWRNPRFADDPHRRQDLLSLQGRLRLANGDGDGALADFDRALAQDPSPNVAAMQTALLASAGDYRQALQHLDGFQRQPRPAPSTWGMARLHAWVLARQGYWPHELGELRRKLRDQLATPGASD
jgi:tetratricopeptide (TPR) repeat protein